MLVKSFIPPTKQIDIAFLAWSREVLAIYADAIAENRLAMVWLPPRSGHKPRIGELPVRMVIQITGNGRLGHHQGDHMLWPDTLVMMADDGGTEVLIDAPPIAQEAVQQLSLYAINQDLVLDLRYYDHGTGAVWRESCRLPAGIGQRWQYIMETALLMTTQSGQQPADVGRPLVEALARMALRATTCQPRPQRQRRKRRRQIEQLVRKHFRQPDCTAATIAAALGVSAVQIRRIFKEYSGESIQRFVTRQRLRYAAQLQAQAQPDEHSDEHLAQACGFCNAAAMRRADEQIRLLR